MSAFFEADNYGRRRQFRMEDTLGLATHSLKTNMLCGVLKPVWDICNTCETSLGTPTVDTVSVSV